MLKDGIVLEDNNGKIVMNQYSFCELIKHLLVYYVGISYVKASEIVDSSHLAEPIESAMDAGLLSHEYAYYWAMSLYYGNRYWEKGISAQPEDLAAYFKLEDSFMKQFHLKEPFESI